MTWDEENRLIGINDNGHIHLYSFDASGERVIKSSGYSQHIAVNGQTAATIVHTDDYTGYVSPYFVINKGKFTKHYFEGAGRIVSKLGNGAFAQPLKLTAGGINYTAITAEQQKALDNYVRSLGVPPGPPTQQGIYATPEFTGDPYPTEVLKPVEENQEPPEGWPRNPVFNAPGDVPGPPVQFGPAVEPATVQAAEGFTGIGLPENDIFYFHPDHLGSTSYISTRNGSISQHVEYIAFGEVLFEEHASSFSSPYLFNGKELDRETNLSYYGARYLDMKTSLWLSVDPLAEEYPNVSPYTYCLNNPINAIDPDGRRVYFVGGAGNDSDGWNYISRFKSLLGLRDFRRVNATHGRNGDVDFVNRYRNGSTSYTGIRWSFRKISVTDDKQYKRALNGILKDLKSKPLKEGEQLNLTGYSYGAVLQEHLAIGLADKGIKVDNLILVGSPTSDNSELMSKLKDYEADGKIGKIIRKDIEGDLLSNPKSDSDFIDGGIQNSPLGDGNNGAHFDLARPGKETDKKIKQLGNELKKQGVE
jgi:RHS repeat-associated protein